MLSSCNFFFPVVTLTLCFFLKQTLHKPAIWGFRIIRSTTLLTLKEPNYSRDYLQATSVSVEDSVGCLTITAIYLPPTHTVRKTQLEGFYSTLGPRFIVGGDYNAKHTGWGSRLITPRGREALKHLKATTYPTSPWAILLTGLLTYIKSLIS
jgi:hypothetical protein